MLAVVLSSPVKVAYTGNVPMALKVMVHLAIPYCTCTAPQSGAGANPTVPLNAPFPEMDTVAVMTTGWPIWAGVADSPTRVELWPRRWAEV